MYYLVCAIFCTTYHVPCPHVYVIICRKWHQKSVTSDESAPPQQVVHLQPERKLLKSSPKYHRKYSLMLYYPMLYIALTYMCIYIYTVMLRTILSERMMDPHRRCDSCSRLNACTRSFAATRCHLDSGNHPLQVPCRKKAEKDRDTEREREREGE